jgi:hypothetical protein
VLLEVIPSVWCVLSWDQEVRALGGNPHGLVAGEGFEGCGEDLLSSVLNAFFEIIGAHGFG